MLTVFLFSIIGHIVSYRILLKSLHQFSLPVDIEKKIMTGSLFLTVIMSCLGYWNLGLAFLLVLSQIAFYHLLPFLVIKALRNEAQKRNLEILDHICLSLQAGRSLKEGIKEAIKNQPFWLRIHLENTYTDIFLHHKKKIDNELFSRLMLEIFEIFQQQTKYLAQIKNLRSQYEILQKFRHKSGQITLQTKMQAIVMIGLYLSLLSFVVYYFGWSSHFRIMTVSILIFCFGTYYVLNIGRKFKWKL